MLDVVKSHGRSWHAKDDFIDVVLECFTRFSDLASHIISVKSIQNQVEILLIRFSRDYGHCEGQEILSRMNLGIKDLVTHHLKAILLYYIVEVVILFINVK